MCVQCYAVTMQCAHMHLRMHLCVRLYVHVFVCIIPKVPSEEFRKQQRRIVYSEDLRWQKISWKLTLLQNKVPSDRYH